MLVTDRHERLDGLLVIEQTFLYSAGVLAEPLTPENLERLRRSVVMLAPRHAAALDREAALAVLEELQRLQHADRRLFGH